VSAETDDEFEEAPSTDDEPAHGEKLLSAVERLVDDVDDLITQVEAFDDFDASSGDADKAQARLDCVAERIISTYSSRAAVAGAATALPALMPGAGTAVALIGGSLVDMTLVLKYEVEMILCLMYLYGYDIRDERERWLGYVLAGVRTYEVDMGRNYFVDLAEAQLDALTTYTPRQLSKLVVGILGKMAMRSVSRNWAKVIPVVGMAVGASSNKLLTSSVGWWCAYALERRRAIEGGLDDDAVIEGELR